jgi:hypothetical protein
MDLRKHNLGGVPAAQIYHTNTDAELAVYDELPPRWRRLVQSLPIKQGMHHIRQYLSVMGERAGYDAIVQTFERSFPGWRSDTISQEPIRRSRRGSRRSSTRSPDATPSRSFTV